MVTAEWSERGRGSVPVDTAVLSGVVAVAVVIAPVITTGALPGTVGVELGIQADGGGVEVPTPTLAGNCWMAATVFGDPPPSTRTCPPTTVPAASCTALA